MENFENIVTIGAASKKETVENYENIMASRGERPGT